MKLILVPTDFSDAAAHAIRYASALARRLDAHLLVLHGDLFIPALDFMLGAAGEFAGSREAMISEARELLIKQAEENIDPRVPFDTRVAFDAPVNAIIDVALETGAELIVMGSHGRTGLYRLVLGSVTESVMRTSHIPVIAVNPATSELGQIRKILCPVTYTEATLDALRAAAGLVNNRNAPIVLLRTIPDSDDPRACAQELMRLRKWLPPELVDRCELKIVSSLASAESILAFASISVPDVIVLGVPRNRRTADVIRGTITERVMQHSSCPVLTVAQAPVLVEESVPAY